MLDNTALDAIAQQQLGIEQPTVEQGNSLVSTIMAAATAPVRFPGARPPLLALNKICFYPFDQGLTCSSAGASQRTRTYFDKPAPSRPHSDRLLT